MRNHSRNITAALLLGGALVLTGCSGTTPTAPAESQQPADPAPSGPADAGAGSTIERDADLAEATFGMSWTDALDAAAKNFEGDPVSLSLEWKRTAFAYGVELVSNTESYEAVFDANTGELMHEETEAESAADVAEKRRGIIKPADLIDPAKAMSAAVAALPGSVEEWEIDDEDGRMSYEVQIITDTGDADVRVDAVSGEIIEIDH